MTSALDLAEFFKTICLWLVGIGGGVAIIVKVIKVINDTHDRYQKYDKYDERIEQLTEKVDTIAKNHETKFVEAHKFAQKELENIKKEMMADNEDIRQNMNDRIEEMQTDVNAKFQQISSELCMLSYCVGATLDGLKQLNCNGKVTEAKDKMDKHLNQQAHGEI